MKPNNQKAIDVLIKRSKRLDENFEYDENPCCSYNFWFNQASDDTYNVADQVLWDKKWIRVWSHKE